MYVAYNFSHSILSRCNWCVRCCCCRPFAYCVSSYIFVFWHDVTLSYFLRDKWLFLKKINNVYYKPALVSALSALKSQMGERTDYITLLNFRKKKEISILIWLLLIILFDDGYDSRKIPSSTIYQLFRKSLEVVHCIMNMGTTKAPTAHCHTGVSIGASAPSQQRRDEFDLSWFFNPKARLKYSPLVLNRLRTPPILTFIFEFYNTS